MAWGRERASRAAGAAVGPRTSDSMSRPAAPLQRPPPVTGRAALRRDQAPSSSSPLAPPYTRTSGIRSTPIHRPRPLEHRRRARPTVAPGQQERSVHSLRLLSGRPRLRVAPIEETRPRPTVPAAWVALPPLPAQQSFADPRPEGLRVRPIDPGDRVIVAPPLTRWRPLSTAAPRSVAEHSTRTAHRRNLAAQLLSLPAAARGGAPTRSSPPRAPERQGAGHSLDG